MLKSCVEIESFTIAETNTWSTCVKNKDIISRQPRENFRIRDTPCSCVKIIGRKFRRDRIMEAKKKIIKRSISLKFKNTRNTILWILEKFFSSFFLLQKFSNSILRYYMYIFYICVWVAETYKPNNRLVFEKIIQISNLSNYSIGVEIKNFLKSRK